MTEYEAFKLYLEAPCDWDMQGKPISNGHALGDHHAYAFAGFQAAWKMQQAKLDALMWEYCPEEMTAEQIEEWGKHQRPDPTTQAVATLLGPKKS